MIPIDNTKTGNTNGLKKSVEPETNTRVTGKFNEEVIETTGNDPKLENVPDINTFFAKMGVVSDLDMERRTQEITAGVEWIAECFAKEHELDVAQLKKRLPRVAIGDSFSQKGTEESTPLLIGGGGYESSVHRITASGVVFQQLQRSEGGFGAHEGDHSLEAIVMTKLNKEQRFECVSRHFLNEARNGVDLPVNLNASMTLAGLLPVPAFINPVIAPQNIRNQIADYLGELYLNLSNNTLDSRLQIAEEENALKKVRYYALSDSGFETLLERVKKESNYGELLEQFNGNEGECRQRLLEHTNSYLYRFQHYLGIVDGEPSPIFIPQEVADTLQLQDLELSQKSEQFAKRAIGDNITAIEAASRMRIEQMAYNSTPARNAQLYYLFSGAELRARDSQIAHDIEALDKELKLDSPTRETLVRQKQTLEAQREFNLLGEELFAARYRLITAPQRSELLAEVNRYNQLVTESRNVNSGLELHFLYDKVKEELTTALTSGEYDQIGTEQEIRTAVELLEARTKLWTKGVSEMMEGVDFATAGMDVMQEAGVKFLKLVNDNQAKILQSLRAINYPEAQGLVRRVERADYVTREITVFDKTLLEPENRLVESSKYAADIETIRRNQARIDELAPIAQMGLQKA